MLLIMFGTDWIKKIVRIKVKKEQCYQVLLSIWVSSTLCHVQRSLQIDLQSYPTNSWLANWIQQSMTELRSRLIIHELLSFGQIKQVVLVDLDHQIVFQQYWIVNILLTGSNNLFWNYESWIHWRSALVGKSNDPPRKNVESLNKKRLKDQSRLVESGQNWLKLFKTGRNYSKLVNKVMTFLIQRPILSEHFGT